MNTKSKIVIAAVTGAALGAAAIQGLHAQAKLKAYSVSELEPLGAGAEPAYLTTVRKAITDAHGRALRTVNGRVVKIEGAEPPKIAALIEWDSLDDAVAFYKSKAWTDLAPQREKTQKTIRRYVVEVEKQSAPGRSAPEADANCVKRGCPPLGGLVASFDVFRRCRGSSACGTDFPSGDVRFHGESRRVTGPSSDIGNPALMTPSRSKERATAVMSELEKRHHRKYSRKLRHSET
jgi:uncharacterized protein (DUF1330 family)